MCVVKSPKETGRGPDGEPLYTHGGLLRVDFKAKALLCPEAGWEVPRAISCSLFTLGPRGKC